MKTYISKLAETKIGQHLLAQKMAQQWAKLPVLTLRETGLWKQLARPYPAGTQAFWVR